MDNFDEFLKSKAIKEDENFKLPESFNKRIDDVLKNLDDKEMNKNRPNAINKNKIFIVAASLAFVLIAGKIAIEMNNKISTGDSVEDMARSTRYMESDEKSESTTMDEAISGNSMEESNTLDSELMIINDNIEYMIIDNKEVTDKDKINRVVSYINSMNLEIDDNQVISNWKNTIELIGNINYTVKISEDHISINDVFYKSNNSKVNELINIIKE